MRRLRMLLMTTALIAGSSVTALGQGWGWPDHDRDRDRDRDRGGYYGGDGNYGNRGYANARQFGYQDGLNDGRNDRFSGHSYRPTHDSNYKHADRGYNGGDRNYYKSMYRQAYEQGYQQGYNSGGNGRGRGRWWGW